MDYKRVFEEWKDVLGARAATYLALDELRQTWWVS